MKPMRYERSIEIITEGTRKSWDFAFEFTVKQMDSRTQWVDVIKTTTGKGIDGTWFWEMCPFHLFHRLNAEMRAEWNAEHGLTVEQQGREAEAIA